MKVSVILRVLLSVPFNMCVSQCMVGSSFCHWQLNCQLQPRDSEAVTVQSALLTLAEVLTGGTWRRLLLIATGDTGGKDPACRTDRWCSSSLVEPTRCQLGGNTLKRLSQTAVPAKCR